VGVGHFRRLPKTRVVWVVREVDGAAVRSKEIKGTTVLWNVAKKIAGCFALAQWGDVRHWILWVRDLGIGTRKRELLEAAIWISDFYDVRNDFGITAAMIAITG
jgi:hypothetical protein